MWPPMCCLVRGNTPDELTYFRGPEEEWASRSNRRYTYYSDVSNNPEVPFESCGAKKPSSVSASRVQHRTGIVAAAFRR